MARATAKWKAKLEKRENFDFKKVASVFQYLLRFSSNWPLKKTCLDPFIFILDTSGIFSFYCSNLEPFLMYFHPIVSFIFLSITNFDPFISILEYFSSCLLHFGHILHVFCPQMKHFSL